MEGPPPRDRWALARLGPAQVVLCGAALARAVQGMTSLEQAAAIVTRNLREMLWDEGSDRPAAVLCRFYRTIDIGQLEPELQDILRAASESDLEDSTKCLTLMGSAGDEPSWNSRQESVGHRAIPLSDPAAVRRLPMVARMVQDLGMSIESVVAGKLPAGDGQSLEEGRVFYVAEAVGSAVVPAQDFVRTHGVKSIIGFGGVLESGDIWAVILFTRVAVKPEVARLFRLLGSDVRVALRLLLQKRFFAA